MPPAAAWRCSPGFAGSGPIPPRPHERFMQHAMDMADSARRTGQDASGAAFPQELGIQVRPGSPRGSRCSRIDSNVRPDMIVATARRYRSIVFGLTLIAAHRAPTDQDTQPRVGLCADRRNCRLSCPRHEARKLGLRLALGALHAVVAREPFAGERIRADIEFQLSRTRAATSDMSAHLHPPIVVACACAMPPRGSDQCNTRRAG